MHEAESHINISPYGTMAHHEIERVCLAKSLPPWLRQFCLAISLRTANDLLYGETWLDLLQRWLSKYHAREPDISCEYFIRLTFEDAELK